MTRARHAPSRRMGPLAMALALLLQAASLSGGQLPEAVEADQIPDYRVIQPGLAVGGQPSPRALMGLETMGFRTIVNLRTRREGAPEEEQVVRALGLDYVWVPISAGSFSLADVVAVEKVLDDPERGPVLLHCASSDRVGAVWAAIQVRDGRSLEEAEGAGRAAGLKSARMWEAVLRVLDLSPVGGVDP